MCGCLCVRTDIKVDGWKILVSSDGSDLTPIVDTGPLVVPHAPKWQPDAVDTGGGRLAPLRPIMARVSGSRTLAGLWQTVSMTPG